MLDVMYVPGDVVVVLTSPTHKAVGDVTRRWLLNDTDVVYTVRMSVTGEMAVFFQDDLSAAPKVRQ